MATFRFTMNVIEEVTNCNTYEVNADSLEEAEALMDEDHTLYEVDTEPIDWDHIDTLWDTLEWINEPRILDLSPISPPED